MAADPRPGAASGYLDRLPAVFQEDAADDGQPTFLGRFLLAFEHVLTGVGDSSDPGLEEVLDGIGDPPGPLRGVERMFDPTAPRGTDEPARPLHRAPASFLDWLSGWVAMSLRADHDEARRRELIANAVQLYRLRGTRTGIERFIQAYSGIAATVDEEAARFQIGDHSQIGVDTRLGGAAPHFFSVIVHVPQVTDIPKYRDLLTAAVEQAKPAHTYYALEFVTPVFQLEVTSQVGVDTVLSPEPL